MDRVALPDPRGLSRRVETLQRVLANRLEHPIASGPSDIGHEHERLVDETTERVVDIERVDGSTRPDDLGGREVEAAETDRQAAQQRLFGRVERLVGPVDRSPQGLMTACRRARPPGEQSEALIQALGDLTRSH